MKSNLIAGTICGNLIWGNIIPARRVVRKLDGAARMSIFTAEQAGSLVQFEFDPFQLKPDIWTGLYWQNALDPHYSLRNKFKISAYFAKKREKMSIFSTTFL